MNKEILVENEWIKKYWLKWMNKEILAINERIKKYWLKMNDQRNTGWKWMNKEILVEMNE